MRELNGYTRFLAGSTIAAPGDSAVEPLASRSLARMIAPLTLALSLLLTPGCFYYVGFFTLEPPESHATKAEELREAGKLEDAIEEYEQHIAARLKSKHRAEDENPYFYKLLIGDLYLELGKPDKALAAYEIALQEKVTPLLTNERLRRLGQWHEERKDYDKAMEVLKRHRDLDPEMFDLAIDRVHKEQVRLESAEENNQWSVE